MNNPLTDDLSLEQFMHIIANICSKLIFIVIFTGISTENLSWSYSKLFKNEQRDTDQHKPEIFCIKEATYNKTAAKIIEIIKTELQIVDNDLHIWNDMIKAISKISIADDSNFEGEIFILKSTYLLVRLFFNIFAK